MKNSRIAQVAYEAYRAFCKALEEHYQPTWEQLSPDDKARVIADVEAIQTDRLNGQQLHERWLNRLKEEGWQNRPILDEKEKVIGHEEFNPVRKYHPGMLPWYDMDYPQQQKNHVFVYMVNFLTVREEGENDLESVQMREDLQVKVQSLTKENAELAGEKDALEDKYKALEETNKQLEEVVEKATVELNYLKSDKSQEEEPLQDDQATEERPPEEAPPKKKTAKK